MSIDPFARTSSSDRSNCHVPPLRPHPILSLLPTPISILITSFVLFTSCTSPTPPPPPPPPAGPDTTSHDFIWQIDTLGDGNSSVLYDVAIINDTTIWAVGEIYLKDSTGQVDPTAYNLARWNGSSWSLSRVPLRDFGSPTFGYYPIRAVLAFSSSDVWVADAGGLAHFDGHNWGRWTVLFNDLNDPTFGATNKMWGSSSDDIYIVGSRGSITHFDGTTWRRIESGTTVDLVDVAGTGPRNAWTAGYDLTTGQASVLLRLVDGLIEKRYEYTPPYPGERSDSLTGIVTAVWTDSDERVLVLDGGNVWTLPSDTRGNGSMLWWGTQEGGFLTGLRGSSSNNIFVSGHFGELGHFNGSAWRWYKQFFSFSNNLHFRSLACKERLVAAVGSMQGRGIVVRGRRP